MTWVKISNSLHEISHYLSKSNAYAANIISKLALNTFHCKKDKKWIVCAERQSVACSWTDLMVNITYNTNSVPACCGLTVRSTFTPHEPIHQALILLESNYMLDLFIMAHVRKIRELLGWEKNDSSHYIKKISIS